MILFSVFSGAADWSEKQRREPGWWFAGVVRQGHAEMMPAVTTEPLTSYYYNWHALSCFTSEKTTRTVIQFPSRPTLPSILATLHLGFSAWSWSCLLQMGTNRLKVRHCYIYIHKWLYKQWYNIIVASSLPNGLQWCLLRAFVAGCSSVWPRWAAWNHRDLCLIRCQQRPFAPFGLWSQSAKRCQKQVSQSLNDCKL